MGLRHCLVLLPLCFLACTGNGASSAPDGSPELAAGDGGPGLDSVPELKTDLPPETLGPCDLAGCVGSAPWAPGTPIFQEATAPWGLAELKVQGTRLSVTDLDGDGWADLLVRNGGGTEQFEAGGQRQRWVLRNNRQGGFEDVTQASGLFTARHASPANGALPGDVLASGDVDNDGDLDVLVATAIHKLEAGQETTELMLNNGDGTFTLGPADSDLRSEGRYAVPAGVAFVDFNRDGLLDVWMTHNMVGGANQPLQDRLYQGDGSGRVLDVTLSVGLKTRPWQPPIANLNNAEGHSWAWSAAACDLDGNGTTELLAASYGRRPNHLWLGSRSQEGQVQFTNHSVASGYAYDHRQDWTDNESARCFCKLHRDAQDCASVPEPVYFKCETDADIFRWNHDTDREPWVLGGNSAATTCADVDNDGGLDLMTGEIVHWDVGSSSDPAELLFNSGQTPLRFERPGNEATGLVRTYPGPVWDNGDMAGTVFDFDNDGWLDVYIGSSDYPYTRGWLFHQKSPRSFERVAVEDYFDHLRSSGVVAADFDRDGDLDVVVGHTRFRCGGDYLDDCYDTPQVRFFENLSADAGHKNWLQVRLQGGQGSNRAAIGARVSVRGCDFTQTREVDGGHGHFGTQDDPVLHFGLGAQCRAEVTVRWPDQALSTQTWVLEGGHRYLLRQGESEGALAD
jgi:hypothetical protein